ncbi:helicase C-terminal domain-containing protein [Kamptonema formosum]|uniref:helicase C-terminal domain-containing protein n=1 Tax=Kamptonema formosum TaxID=331992 RepID=UPI00047697BA|nr:helicase C-terminal domain-containing protein [Oscillatoria sp. PCC 10802]
MIEVEVHNSLRTFLRSAGEPMWPHHLTMARLVARALRLERSALMQTGVSPTAAGGRYRLSYLMPLLMWPNRAVLVAAEEVQQRVLNVEIPQLQQWLDKPKAIRTGSRWPSEGFQGLLLTTPEAWLKDRLEGGGGFPAGVVTVVDGADDLEEWAERLLSAGIHPGDWNELMLARPDRAEAIRDARVRLTRAVFQHPANPYECCLMEAEEREILTGLFRALQPSSSAQTEGGPELRPDSSWGLPAAWCGFWQRWQTNGQLLWAEIARRQGLFSLFCSPVEVAEALSPVWQQQPVVLIGAAMDLEVGAPIYRQRLGLGELTCLKFSPARQNELIQLYLPDRLPLPNTPQFQEALMREFRALLGAGDAEAGLTVLIVGDVPLKARAGAALAAEFGSRVQVERTCLDDRGILVTGWEFWLANQGVLPAPHLLAIATLPVPSLENPLVAGRVAHYKQQRLDWFRLYLLPKALSTLQLAIRPVRDCQGVVALFDSRVLHRSYGHQVLAALSPLARTDYLDPSWFAQPDRS